jgi:hypothetical protein
MPAPQDDEVANVADEIARYLAAHAHAADSLEGIAKWWLTRQRIEEALGTIELALQRLAAVGIVGSFETNTGQIIYFNRAAQRANASGSADGSAYPEAPQGVPIN